MSEDLTSPYGDVIPTYENVGYTALDSSLGMATDIGAIQQGLSFSEDNYTMMEASLTEALSAQDDTDIAAEITKLRSESTLNQMALHAQKMFMHNSAQVLSLLP